MNATICPRLGVIHSEAMTPGMVVLIRELVNLYRKVRGQYLRRRIIRHLVYDSCSNKGPPSISDCAAGAAMVELRECGR